MLNNITPQISHQAILEQIHGFFMVMDEHSRCLYTNDNTARLCGYPSADSFAGNAPEDMRCSAAECADEFKEQDRVVRETNTTVLMLDVHTYAGDQPKLYLGTKKPFYQGGRVIGSICHGTEVYDQSIAKLTAKLVSLDKNYYPKQSSIERSYQFIDNDKTIPLTKREMECLFYIARGFTAKMTAEAMTLSPRTVEDYLAQIKQKLGIISKAELIAYCLHHGLLSYIPQSLFDHNLSGVLHHLS